MTVDQIITSDPDVQGGTVVFAGTRVPLKNLIDYLEAGDSLEEFRWWRACGADHRLISDTPPA